MTICCTSPSVPTTKLMETRPAPKSRFEPVEFDFEGLKGFGQLTPPPPAMKIPSAGGVYFKSFGASSRISGARGMLP